MWQGEADKLDFLATNVPMIKLHEVGLGRATTKVGALLIATLVAYRAVAHDWPGFGRLARAHNHGTVPS